MNTDIQSRISGYAFFTMIVAAIGGILYGYEIGMINAAILFINKSIPMSTAQTSAMVASVFAGGFIATLLAGPISDSLGRRNLMIFASLFFVVGIIILATSHHVSSLITGRLIQGVGIGIVSILIPLYLSETMPYKWRGRAVGAFQLVLTLGIVLANLVGFWLSASGNWRAMIWSAVIPGAIFSIGIFAIPKSPRWLFAKGREKQAMDVLKKMQSAEAAESEFKSMTEKRVNNFGNVKALGNLFRRPYVYPLLVVFAAAMLQQFLGINSIFQYNATILHSAGFSQNSAAALGGVWISLLNMFMTIVAMVLVDKLGRKPLLIIGLSGVILGLLFAAASAAFIPTGPFKAEMILTGMMVFIIFYAVGPGLVVWLILSEMLPTAVRSAGMGIGLSLNTLASTLLATVFMPLSGAIGYGGTFLLCAIAAALYLYLAAAKMPETKNKKLEEIEEFFNRKSKKRMAATPDAIQAAADTSNHKHAA